VDGGAGRQGSTPAGGAPEASDAAARRRHDATPQLLMVTLSGHAGEAGGKEGRTQSAHGKRVAIVAMGRVRSVGRSGRTNTHTETHTGLSCSDKSCFEHYRTEKSCFEHSHRTEGHSHCNKGPSRTRIPLHPAALASVLLWAISWNALQHLLIRVVLIRVSPEADDDAAIHDGAVGHGEPFAAGHHHRHPAHHGPADDQALPARVEQAHAVPSEVRISGFWG